MQLSIALKLAFVTVALGLLAACGPHKMCGTGACPSPVYVNSVDAGPPSSLIDACQSTCGETPTCQVVDAGVSECLCQHVDEC